HVCEDRKGNLHVDSHSTGLTFWHSARRAGYSLSRGPYCWQQKSEGLLGGGRQQTGGWGGDHLCDSRVRGEWI
ncbi:unnamed protein product, partial [Staurois parvus]